MSTAYQSHLFFLYFEDSWDEGDLIFDLLNSMADSFSCNNCADTEDSKSNLSLSVGYYPNEDTFSNEDTNSCEDTSSNNSSIHFVPTKSTGRLMERQDQIQDGTEQSGKLGIPLAWDVGNHSDSVTNWDLYGDNQRIDKYPEEKPKLTLSKLNGYQHPSGGR